MSPGPGVSAPLGYGWAEAASGTESVRGASPSLGAGPGGSGARLVVPCVCRAVTTAPSCVSWPPDSVLISLATSVHTDSARRGMDSVQRQTGIGPILPGERCRFLGKQLCCLESHLEHH